MSLYTVEKFTLTNFLIENNKLYNEIFIQRETLYTLDQVYTEIHNIVDAVSVLHIVFYAV